MKNKIKRWNGNFRFKATEKGRMYFKYNEDDILEILSEHLAREHGFGTFASTSILFGTPRKDLRLISVISDVDDMEIYQLDKEEVDRNMDFNGTH